MSSDEILDMQHERLTAVLKHALKFNTFYRRRMNCVGINTIGSNAFETLQKLAPLSKHEIQENIEGMTSEGHHSSKLLQNQTGGSTGEPIRFYLDQQRLESRVAGTIRHDRWAGHDIGHRAAYVWGAPRDLPSNSWKAKVRNRLLGGQLWLDASSITDSAMRQFDVQLKRFRPRTIVAYANALLMLAAFFRESGISAYQPRGIITSAELLTDSGRKAIEDVFGCKVFNRYGCREFSVVASECEQHDGMHLMAEGLYVEVESSNKRGDTGNLLVTDLYNNVMPMIRYRIGDRGSLQQGTCKCGRGLPRLKSLDGRVTDFLMGDSGQLVSGVFLATYVVAQRPSLGRVQIVQDREGEALFRIVPGQRFDKDSDYQYLVETTRQHLGPDTSIDIEIVDELLKSPSGKVQFSISRALPEYAAVNE